MTLTLSELQAIETEIVSEIASICERNGIDYFMHCGSALGAVRHGGPIPWDSDVDMIIPIDQFGQFLDAARKQLPEKFYVDYYDTNKDYPTFFPRIGLKGFNTFLLHVDIFKLTGTAPGIKKQKRFARRAKRYLQLFRIKTNLKKYYGGEVSFKMRMGGTLLRPFLFFISRNYLIKRFEALCHKYPYATAEYVTNPSGGYGVKNVQKKNIYGKGMAWKYSGVDIKIPEKYNDYLEHYYGDYMIPPRSEQRKTKNHYQLTQS